MRSSEDRAVAGSFEGRAQAILETAALDGPPCSCHSVPEGCCPGASVARYDRLAIAALIDHTLLKPEATAETLERHCAEAADLSFATVCVNPKWVGFCTKRLQGSRTQVCTVVGFPLGATGSLPKSYEARWALDQGASELDMVAPLGSLKGGDWADVEADISAVVSVAREREAVVKVILETALLTPEEIVRGALIAQKASADFVKTSTGFGPGGATTAHVALLRHAVGRDMGVKAAGGIRDLKTLIAMIEVGANRIGTSSGAAILASV